MERGPGSVLPREDHWREDRGKDHKISDVELSFVNFANGRFLGESGKTTRLANPVSS